MRSSSLFELSNSSFTTTRVCQITDFQASQRRTLEMMDDDIEEGETRQAMDAAETKEDQALRREVKAQHEKTADRQKAEVCAVAPMVVAKFKAFMEEGILAPASKASCSGGTKSSTGRGTDESEASKFARWIKELGEIRNGSPQQAGA